MNLTERLKRGLMHTRGFTDRILGEIRFPDDWIRRPAPQANHAMWIAGHLGLATNSFMYDVGAVFQMAAWHEALHAGQLTVIHRMIGEKPFTER